MARRRIYGTDHTLGDWHRTALAELYRRTGHRLDMADRDWTEFCHWCKEPLLIWEEVLDRGQDLTDKAVTVTRRLGQRADLPAWLVAPRIERPPEVQQEIDRLNADLRRLEERYPIAYFTVRRIWPQPGRLHRMTQEGFADELFLVHRDHHQDCRSLPYQYRVDPERIRRGRDASPLWLPQQLVL